MNQSKNKMLVYIAAAVVYLILMIGAVTFGEYIATRQQVMILVNIAMGAGFLGYLKINDYEMNFGMRIYDKKCLYIVCSLIFLMVIGSYYPINEAFGDDITENVWLLVEALSAAVAVETVFRALGGYCFEKPGLKEAVIMIVCCTALNLYRCFCDAGYGIMVLITALGTATMMTGLFLRYNKIGANMAISFLTYYLVNVTALNSTANEAIFGKSSPYLVIVAAVGMIIYGCMMLKTYNAKGAYNDAEEVKQYSERQGQFKQAFMENKTKYEEKVNEKAAPTIEARREKYIEKQQIKEEKRKEKKRAKDERGKQK